MIAPVAAPSAPLFVAILTRFSEQLKGQWKNGSNGG
jgi:hypothetical protein